MYSLDVAVLIGRIEEIIEVSKNQINLLLEISYKTTERKDIIKRRAKIKVYNTIAEKVLENCKPRDLVSIKAYVDMNEDNENILVAEQVAFMAFNYSQN